MNSRILTTPWAIFPPAANEALKRLEPRADIEPEDFFTMREELEISDGVAHISIYGPLVDDAPPIAEMVGMTDYRTVIEEIKAAKGAGVNLIVFHIDSPGGMVSGLREVIAAINGCGISTIADCRGMACSAAYWIASACDMIQASPSCDLGSIGVVTVWINKDAMAEMMGIQINVMTNEGADLKGMGMGSSLTESQIQWTQERLNAIGQEFRAQVEGNRPNIDPEVFRAGHYSGMRALQLGLCDSILSA